MGDTVENNSQIPAGYELVEDYERGQSYLRPVDEGEALFSSQTCEASPPPDSFRPQPEHLDLDSRISLPGDSGHSSHRREVTLRRLLVEAGQGTEWATQGLEDFLSQRLALTSSHNLEMCYASTEANVGDLLVQLRYGDGVARREAAKSILGIILGQPVDAGEDLHSLQRGLLVAAGQISRITESDIFYQEVAQLDLQQRQQLWAMSHDSRVLPDPQLLVTLKNSPNFRPRSNEDSTHQNNSPVAYALVGGGAVPSANLGEGRSVRALASTGFPSSVTDFQTLSTIQGILSESIRSGGSNESFIHTPAGRALSIRLGEIATTPGLTPAQISNTAYIAILANRFSDFDSAEAHYGEFRPLAAQIAGNIVRGLGIAEGDSALPRGFSRAVLASSGISTEVTGSNPTENPSQSGSVRRLAQSFANDLRSSLGFFAGQGNGVAPAVLGTVANSSTAAAGMMGINFLALAGGSSLPSLSRGTQSRPHYYVEGTTSSERDGNSGSGSHSSGQGQQDQGRDQGQGENIYVA